jgi:hypothetical protein
MTYDALCREPFVIVMTQSDSAFIRFVSIKSPFERINPYLLQMAASLPEETIRLYKNVMDDVVRVSSTCDLFRVWWTHQFNFVGCLVG